MKEFYGFFDPWEGDDRQYSADEFVTAFRAVGGTGVGDGLTLSPAGGMGVRVAPGLAMVHGYVYSLADDGGPPMDLVLSPSGSADRIDRIILRLDLTAGARNITMGVLEGTPAANPAPPALTRTDSVKEISLGRALVRAASAALLEGDLTDERIDAAVCGMLVPPSLQLSSLDARYTRTVDGVGVDGAGDAALKAVRYGTVQALTAPQRAQARDNIGAAEALELQELQEAVDSGLAAKLDKANVANSLTTTAAGYALDARQGKALGDSLAAISGLRIDKIWENSAPDDAVSAATYSIPALTTANYNFVGVVVRSVSGYQNAPMFLFPFFTGASWTTFTSVLGNVYGRNVVFNAGSAAFTNGRLGAADNPSANIPYIIYGIKVG